MKEVVIAGYARSPFTFASKGELSRIRPDELTAQTVSVSYTHLTLPTIYSV